MASYKNFQTDNHKISRNRYDPRNPELNPSVSARGVKEQDNFTKNLDKYVKFVSWARWNPDLWYDLITPERGGIRLDLDQRVFLRVLARFVSFYGVFPRGYGKTFLEVMGMIHAAIFFPDIRIAMSAQTQENAAKILKDKFDELIKYYPLLKNELDGTPNFSKDRAEIRFLSGGVIDILANQQSSKGQRRRRLNIEESALLNNELFEDVLEPIPNVPRRTIGKKSVVNPEEMNGQINFFTTSGFRGSTEFYRNVQMVKEMAELKGKIVLGSDWRLAVHYGRGEPRSVILDKKARLSPVFFAQNYESKWVGATDGAIVNINKFLKLRTLKKHELKSDGKHEYVMSIDVARSNSENNNKTSISILKIKRNDDGVISRVPLVNLINLPNGLTFTAQSIEIKRIRKIYDAKAVVVDANGLGTGLVDELLKEHIDPDTGESLGCWDTMNTNHQPELENAEQILYVLNSQGINHDIIVNFIDMVESGKLQLLIKIDNNDYPVNDMDYFKDNILPYVHTDLLVEEVANLKLKQLSSGKYTIEQVTNRVGKDRYSSLAYGLWYIKHFENYNNEKNDNFNILDYLYV